MKVYLWCVPKLLFYFRNQTENWDCSISWILSFLWCSYCGLIQSQDSGWAYCRLINNCHMAHTLHKTFQCKSNCWKHAEGYQIGCTVLHEKAQPSANKIDFAVALTINVQRGAAVRRQQRNIYIAPDFQCYDWSQWSVVLHGDISSICKILTPSTKWMQAVQLNLLQNITQNNPPTKLLHEDLKTQVYLHFSSGYSVSLTTSGGGLADRITILPQCVLGAFTTLLSCGQALSDSNPITKTHFNAKWGVREVTDLSRAGRHFLGCLVTVN